MKPAADTTRARAGAGLGYVLAVLQAACFATSGVIARYSYGTGLTPEQVTLVRFLGTASVAIGVLFFSGQASQVVSRQPLVYLQGVLFAVSNYLFLVAVAELSAGLATVIFFAGPAVIALLAVPVYRERLTARTTASVVLTLAGILLISGIWTSGVDALSPVGLAYAVTGMLGMAVYALLGQRTLKAEGPMTVTATVALLSSVFALVAFPAQIPALAHLTGEQWGLAAAIAVVTAALPIIFQLAAIARIGATRASLISVVEAPIALVIAFIALGEVLTGNQVLGSLLIVASVLTITIPARRRRPSRTSD